MEQLDSVVFVAVVFHWVNTPCLMFDSQEISRKYLTNTIAVQALMSIELGHHDSLCFSVVVFHGMENLTLLLYSSHWETRIANI